jgi:hypothetical protein
VQLRHGFLALVAVAGLTVSAFGQDAVTLKWKFEVNKTFWQEMTTTTDQTMKVMGTDVKQTQTQTFWFAWTPQKNNADGSWEIEQKIVGVKMTIDIGGNKVEYDSTKENPGTNPLADFFKALVGSKFVLTLDKDYKVTKITGREEFIAALSKANPQMEKLLKQILSEKALMDMADPTFSVVSGKEIKKDTKWDKMTTLDMGPIGTYKNTFTYTYEGKNTDGKTDAEKKLDKIKVETKLEYSPPKDQPADSTLPFKIKSASLTSKDATGTILFDNDAGRIDSSSMKLTLEGQLSIEISGQTTQVDLKQTQTTTTKTTDKEPDAIKKKGT